MCPSGRRGISLAWFRSSMETLSCKRHLDFAGTCKMHSFVARHESLGLSWRSWEFARGGTRHSICSPCLRQLPGMREPHHPGLAFAILAAAESGSLRGRRLAVRINCPRFMENPRRCINRSAREAARKAGLRYSTSSNGGIHRRSHGKSFIYVNSHGKRVRNPRTLARIRALVIPPAWTDVWISSKANQHLQATGRDARGRKQHRYHARWREQRDATKFEHVVTFARVLPRIRRRVARDLKNPGLPRKKVLAAIVRLLETSLIRVGNDEYARDNGSFGLTQVTLLMVKIVHRVRTYVHFLLICSTTFVRSRYLRLASAKEWSSCPDLASSHDTEFPLHRH